MLDRKVKIHVWNVRGRFSHVQKGRTCRRVATMPSTTVEDFRGCPQDRYGSRGTQRNGSFGDKQSMKRENRQTSGAGGRVTVKTARRARPIRTMQSRYRGSYGRSCVSSCKLGLIRTPSLVDGSTLHSDFRTRRRARSHHQCSRSQLMTMLSSTSVEPLLACIIASVSSGSA